LVKKFRTSQINQSAKALRNQGHPGDRNYTLPVYPTPYISKFTQTGLMEITFSHEVQTVPNVSMITNGTIEVYGTVVPVFDLQIKGGEDSVQELLTFSYRVVAQTSTTITI